jgi:hypothetical protein
MLERPKNAGWIAAFVALCAAWSYEANERFTEIPIAQSHEHLACPHPWKVRSGRDARAWSMVKSILRRTVLRSGEALVNELIRRAMLKKNISIGGSPPVDSRRRYETTTGRDKTDESSAEKMNLAADALGQADDPAFAAVALNAPPGD